MKIIAQTWFFVHSKRNVVLCTFIINILSVHVFAASTINPPQHTLVYNVAYTNGQDPHSKHLQEQLNTASKQQHMERKGIVSVMIGTLTMLLIVAFFFYKTSQLNELLSKTNKQLRESNDVKDKLFSVLGHDLRSPFISMIGLLELMKNDDTLQEDKKALLQQLEITNKASLEILTNLLKWGEMQIKGIKVNPSAFVAKGIVDRTVAVLADSAAFKGITIKNAVSSELCIHADADHFEFVMRNLIANAIKFSYNDSEVIVDASRDSSNGTVAVTVADHGIGIPLNQQHSIFGINNTSTAGTSNEKGTSMGLLLCKEFIGLNKGLIKAENNMGSGSVFTVTLNAAETFS